MIKSPSQRTSDDYSPEELLILLIYIYSVTGEFTMDKDLRGAEERVKKALALVLSEESELSPLLQKITGGEAAQMFVFNDCRVLYIVFLETGFHILSILLGFVGGFISFIKCQSNIEGLDSINLVTLSRVTVSAIVSCTPEAIGPLPVQLPLKRRAPYPFQIAKISEGFEDNLSI
ncbi:hypothetical protein STEG23_010765 [Scotinomys teguina]